MRASATPLRRGRPLTSASLESQARTGAPHAQPTATIAPGTTSSVTNPFDNQKRNDGYCGFTNACAGLANQLLNQEVYRVGDTVPMGISVSTWDNGTSAWDVQIAEYFPTVDSWGLLIVPNCAAAAQGPPRCSHPARTDSCLGGRACGTPATALNVSMAMPNVTLKILTRGGYLSLPDRAWAANGFVVGFRSAVITLDRGTPPGIRYRTGGARRWSAHAAVPVGVFWGGSARPGRKHHVGDMGRRAGLLRGVLAQLLHRQRVRHSAQRHRRRVPNEHGHQDLYHLAGHRRRRPAPDQRQYGRIETDGRKDSRAVWHTHQQASLRALVVRPRQTTPTTNSRGGGRSRSRR